VNVRDSEARRPAVRELHEYGPARLRAHGANAVPSGKRARGAVHAL